MQEKGIHDGHRQRLRQRFIESSLDAFADHEIIELLLTYAIPRRDVNALAHEILNKFGSFSAVADASVDELCKVCGLSQNTAVLLALMSHVSRRYSLDQIKVKQQFSNMETVFKYGQSLFQGAKYESFYILCLDSKLHLIKPVLISEGTIDSVVIYPRLVVEKCLNYGAQSVIIMHNHPSGDPCPSNQDVAMTKNIVNALHAIDIKVYDHIIVSYGDCFSFKQQGLLSGSEVSPLRRAAEIRR